MNLYAQDAGPRKINGNRDRKPGKLVKDEDLVHGVRGLKEVGEMAERLDRVTPKDVRLPQMPPWMADAWRKAGEIMEQPIIPKAAPFVGPPSNAGGPPPSFLEQIMGMHNPAAGGEFTVMNPPAEQRIFPGGPRNPLQGRGRVDVRPVSPNHGARPLRAEDVRMLAQRQATGGGGGPVTSKKEAEAMPVAAGTAANPTEFVADDKDLAELKGFIRDFENDKKIDLSPLLALSDSWTGGRLQAGYNRPMSDEERQQAVLKLKTVAAEKEADIRYKKAYLKAMSDQDATRVKLKEMELDSDEEVARIRVGGRRSGAPDLGKVVTKLRSDYKGILTQISTLKNPKGWKGDKTPENLMQLEHMDAVAMAEEAFAAGAVKSFEEGYAAAVMSLLQEAKEDAAGRKSREEEE